MILRDPYKRKKSTSTDTDEWNDLRSVERWYKLSPDRSPFTMSLEQIWTQRVRAFWLPHERTVGLKSKLPGSTNPSLKRQSIEETIRRHGLVLKRLILHDAEIQSGGNQRGVLFTVSTKEIYGSLVVFLSWTSRSTVYRHILDAFHGARTYVHLSLYSLLGVKNYERSNPAIMDNIAAPEEHQALTGLTSQLPSCKSL